MEDARLARRDGFGQRLRVVGRRCRRRASARMPNAFAACTKSTAGSSLRGRRRGAVAQHAVAAVVDDDDRARRAVLRQRRELAEAEQHAAVADERDASEHRAERPRRPLRPRVQSRACPNPSDTAGRGGSRRAGARQASSRRRTCRRTRPSRTGSAVSVLSRNVIASRVASSAAMRVRTAMRRPCMFPAHGWRGGSSSANGPMKRASAATTASTA